MRLVLIALLAWQAFAAGRLDSSAHAGWLIASAHAGWLIASAHAEGGLEVDALLATVGRDAVLLSDVQRFADVDKVLRCAGVVKRKEPLPTDRKALLNAYIDEELFYQEARAKKTNTSGQIPLSVQQIQSKEACRSKWLALGDRYSKTWKTEIRAREGESMLVRELEKRVLVERFISKESMPDAELWKREALVRFPVKIFLE